MNRILCLVRHGRAGGHAPESELLPEGAEHVTKLARRLASERFAPAAAFSSPYRRALESARILLRELAPEMRPTTLAELTPDHDPEDALTTLDATGPGEGRILVVGHLPLLALIAQQLTGEDPRFSPGTLVEIEWDAGRGSGRLVRRLGIDSLGA